MDFASLKILCSFHTCEKFSSEKLEKGHLNPPNQTRGIKQVALEARQLMEWFPLEKDSLLEAHLEARQLMEAWYCKGSDVD